MADTQWVVGDDITGGAKEVAKARVERSSTPLSWPGSDAFPRKLGRMELGSGDGSPTNQG